MGHVDPKDVGKRMLRSRGFTLIELMVTLAVAIVLATAAVPGFQSMMARNQLASDFNEILSGLNYARSEAIKRRDLVTFSVDDGGPGWTYSVSLSDGSPLRQRKAGNNRVSSTEISVEFDHLGRIDGGGCDAGACDIEVSRGELCRVITINNFGRSGRSDNECQEG
jgi:type IV fimbrial biogenesis protein FimT